LGRSRGGLSSKLHLATDGRGLPMSVVLTGGQAGDNPQLLPVPEGIRVARPATVATAGGGGGQGVLPPLNPYCDAAAEGAVHQPGEG
jgi:hypothetical protein